MSTDFNNPESWLEAVRREGLRPAPERYEHPGDPNHHEHVADRTSELRQEQRLVTSLTELRRPQLGTKPITRLINRGRRHRHHRDRHTRRLGPA
jgi:hypothetical protein